MLDAACLTRLPFKLPLTALVEIAPDETSRNNTLRDTCSRRCCQTGQCEMESDTRVQTRTRDAKALTIDADAEEVGSDGFVGPSRCDEVACKNRLGHNSTHSHRSDGARKGGILISEHRHGDVLLKRNLPALEIHHTLGYTTEFQLGPPVQDDQRMEVWVIFLKLFHLGLDLVRCHFIGVPR